MTNLIHHGACRLDINSDEEMAGRVLQERAEGYNKENVPPADDVSQTSYRMTPSTATDDNVMTSTL